MATRRKPRRANPATLQEEERIRTEREAELLAQFPEAAIEVKVTAYRPARQNRPRCGARRRDGHPCQAPMYMPRNAEYPPNGRCRMHRGYVSREERERKRQIANAQPRQNGRFVRLNREENAG